MGIKGNFKKVLAEICPQAFSTVPLTTFSGKTLAIDFSNLYIKYKAVFKDEWAKKLFNYLNFLRAKDVNLLVVFDGPSPALKMDERTRRKERQEKYEERIRKLEEHRKVVVESGVVHDDVVAEIERKNRAECILYDAVMFTEKSHVLVELDEIIEKLENGRQPKFSSHEINEFFEACKKEGIAALKASGEAEHTCAWLAKNGLVEYVLSEDTDLIALQAPFMVTKTKTPKSPNMEYTLFDVNSFLEAKSFTENMLLDWCILCGTDYNKSLPSIGPKTAYKLIQKHLTLSRVVEALGKPGYANEIKYDDIKSLMRLEHIDRTAILAQFDEAMGRNL